MAHHEPKLQRAYDKGIRFFSPGVYVLMVFSFICIGIAFGRFFFGLQAVTNLDNDYPWGIWKGINIASFIVLGAAGFTLAFISHIYGHHKYNALSRQGIIFGLLCYTFAPISLIVDLGRYWQVWHPIFPRWWQGNSVLFEVAICVMLYLTVLLIEFVPFVVEKYRDTFSMPFPLSLFNGLARFILRLADTILLKTKFPLIEMPLLAFFMVLGVVLSCLHQSSLGTLMVIAGTKVNPLWQSPMLPLLFLTSAIAVGFPMVAFLSLVSSYSFGKKPDIGVLKDLLAYTPYLLGIYFILKMYDFFSRGAQVYLLDSSMQRWAWLIEITLLVIPLFMFMSKSVRKSPNHIFLASTLAILSMVFNRVNVLNTAYRPIGVEHVYVPSFGEILFTIGLISTMILIFRFIVIYVPILKEGDDIVKCPPEKACVVAAEGTGGAE
jgi:Ni/Fe-hydrogenase subunit HybB-like protein